MEAMGEEEDGDGQAVVAAGAKAWRGDTGAVPALGVDAQVPEGPWQGASGRGDSAQAELSQDEDHYSSGGQLYWEEGEEFEEDEGEDDASPSVPAQAWASVPGSVPGDSRETSASSPSEGAGTRSNSSAGDGAFVHSCPSEGVCGDGCSVVLL